MSTAEISITSPKAVTPNAKAVVPVIPPEPYAFNLILSPPIATWSATLSIASLPIATLPWFFVQAFSPIATD